MMKRRVLMQAVAGDGVKVVSPRPVTLHNRKTFAKMLKGEVSLSDIPAVKSTEHVWGIS